jgi:diamine N-acetyltransferase
MPLLNNTIISLRAPEPEDLDKLYEWENNASLWELGSTRSPYSRYLLKQYIADSENDIYTRKQLRLIIELKETNTAVGTIDLYDFDPHHHRAGVGILIDVAHQRKGFAKNALQLLIDYAFSFLNLHQLYAHIPVTNTPSLCLFAQCGFKTTGILKDRLLSPNGYVDVAFAVKINTAGVDLQSVP